MTPLISSSHDSPCLNDAQRRQLFGEILSAVSRSFYLTLRVLPSAVREQIGLAYLLARAADTVADTTLVTVDRRLDFLHRFQAQLATEQLSSEIAEIPALLGDQQGDIDEKRLLKWLPQLFLLLNRHPPADRERIRLVVNTLISGMVLDLESFPSEESGELTALESAQVLDRYTYLVAGCVGEFWTTTSIAHVPALKQWDERRFSRLGIRLGKALQYTNILRDLPRDLRMGRCYLPREHLARHQLVPEMLLDPASSQRAKACLDEYISLATEHYLVALDYVTAIPRRCVRLRLAALWPVLIGLATLQKMAQSRCWLDPAQTIKVDRKWVYRMVATSLLCVSFNSLVRRWVRRLAGAR